MNDFEMVQSWVTANPIKVGDGTLRVIQGSHKFHAEFREAFKGQIPHEDKNWHVLTEEQVQWLKDRGCRDLCMVVPGTQFGNLKKILPLIFYVKSIRANSESQNSLLQFRGFED